MVDKATRTVLKSGLIEGRSAAARRGVGTIVGTLAAQRRLFVLTSPAAEEKRTFHVVVIGDECEDGLFAMELAHAWNAYTGPNLSPDLGTEGHHAVWIGRCRQCGEVVSGVTDRIHWDGRAEWVLTEVGRMVADGLAIDRILGPVALSECRCTPRKTVGNWTLRNDDAEGGQA